MMTSPWIAALFALFVWWFSTGAILWVVKSADRHGPHAHFLSSIFGLPFLLAGCYGVWQTLDSDGVAAVYCAFLSALAIWGWVELAFLSGVVTGPNPVPCPPGTAGIERFLRAWGTVAFHEVLLVVCLAALVIASHDAVNTFALWTFAVLYTARISAKLNLFLGVPKINVEFLPGPLSHLPSHFRRRSQSWIFPVSITLLSFATACWLERIHSADSPGAEVGFALLAALTALALLEHWLMVLALPDEKLWRWMIPAPRPEDKKLTPGE
ncbi:MAG: putative photosynthetic complex assembly protein PuhE [Rhodobacter sp.]|nr:putative photosynthetic complex assembly protein PuhE [Rhodobacter sp.]